MRIPSKKQNRIVQIEITSRCDKTCFNCTRALAQHRKPDMTPAQFEQAVIACKDWIIRERGVLSMFGGNPVLHGEFETLAEILATHLPEQNRGLWSNNLLGKGEMVAEYFGPKAMFNLNVHGDEKAAAEMREYLPWARVYGEHTRSQHASIFLASKDVLPEAELWKRVKKCHYDIEWSAIIVQEPSDWSRIGGYSCEIASTHARLRQQALGVPVIPGWLDLPLEAFRHQYEFACPLCSGCLNVPGVDDLGENGRDQFSISNQDLIPLTISTVRRTELVHSFHQTNKAPTDYLGMRK